MIGKFLKELGFLLELIATIVMLLIFRLIGMRAASYLAGVLTRLIGKRHRAHRTAYRNVGDAFPGIEYGKRVELLDGMWMSLGRIIGEYIFICRIKMKALEKIVQVDEKTLQNIEKIKNSKKGGLIVSAHLGNWDVGLRYLMLSGVKINVLYRPLNNKYVDRLMGLIRQYDPIAKGMDGIRDIVGAVKRGEYVIILADQRVGDGEKIKFFHKEALTTTSIARIALKYGVDIVPARSIRLADGSSFKIEVGSALEIKRSSDAKIDAVNIMTDVNKILESWVRQTPEQWFWVHNRWK